MVKRPSENIFRRPFAFADGVDYTPEERQKYLALAKLTAGTVVALSGGDVNTAAAAADIAVKDNFLKALTSSTKVLYKVFKTAANQSVYGI